MAVALTMVAVRDLTGSRALALLAAVLEVAIYPRTYSYPKVLVPAVTLLLVANLGRAPRSLLLAALAVWTMIAAQLRHDLGAFSALAVVVGLLST